MFLFIAFYDILLVTLLPINFPVNPVEDKLAILGL